MVEMGGMPTQPDYKPILIPIFVFVFSIVLFRSVFFIGAVPTESMEPTIKEQSLVLGYCLDKNYQIGDVVIFRQGKTVLVKRIAYTEGDSVMHNGKILTVPKGCFYVLGDNPDNSLDSRYWKDPFVSQSDIIAKVIIPDCGNKAPAVIKEGSAENAK